MENNVILSTMDLPLDWTRVSRKRGPCCVGTACRHRTSTSSSNPSSSSTTSSAMDQRAKRVYKGQVIVCLHESNPDWFQAYFFTENGQVWGLLGTQKEIDECLRCQEGGYRVIDLKLTWKQKQETTFMNVEWTGGDMMDLKGSDVSMQAVKIMTESAAVPVLERLFSALIRQVESEGEPIDDALQVFPELTIVVGHMELRLPVAAMDDLMEDES